MTLIGELDQVLRQLISRARQEPASYHYELTGIAGPAADVHAGEEPGQRHIGSDFVITAGDQAFVALTAGPASMVAAGSRVTAQCTFSVVADCEWDAFGRPDLRSDWYVHRPKIEHRQVDYVVGAENLCHLGRCPGERSPALWANCKIADTRPVPGEPVSGHPDVR